ncbi:MAG TPA: glycosyltransferase family 39 protein, partial [Roseiflexaceae bacterium]|nr:glycosyltransferase family 39 protein [Roseiflexaceae bacterium]
MPQHVHPSAKAMIVGQTASSVQPAVHRPSSIVHRRVAVTAGLALAVLLAVALRLVFWWAQGRSGAVQPGDSEEYYRSALGLLHGGYYDTGKWLRPPLYPALLALMFLIGGVNVSWALFGQAVVTGVGVLAFAALGWQLFERRAVAVLSALMAALFVPLAQFGSLLFAEALFVVLIVLALALLVRAMVNGRWQTALMCGIVLGLATLTRAVALSFIPVAALLVLVFQPRRHEGTKILPASSSRLRVFVVNAAALLLGAALVIGPWTARNYVAYHRFIPVDTNGGISFWYGTITGEQEQLAGEQRIFAVPNQADRQALAVRMALDNIAADPVLFISRTRFKIASLYLLLLRSYAVGDIISISPDGGLVVVGSGELPFWPTVIADAEYVLIMLFGIAGVCFAPHWRRALPVLLWIVFGTLLSAVTLGHPRLRLPLVGAMIPFAAYALARGTTFIFSKRRRNWGTEEHGNSERYRQSSIVHRRSFVLRLALALGGCLVFLALIFSMRYLTWLRGEQYAFPGRQALAAGDMPRAQALFERARAADPTNALRVVDLADLSFAQGKYQQAFDLYGAALKLEDRNLYAHAMRVRTAALLGQPDVARAEWQAIRD